MRVDEPVTVWRTHVGGGAPRDSAAWWWAARHHAARQRAAVATFAASWDPQRETVQPLPGGPAADVAAAHGTLSTATRLHGFIL